jgi:peptide/nickel transport system ATP-binding protein
VTALLDVSGLSIRFRGDDGVVHAVEDLSFELHGGEILGLVGESGCGKSVTALSIMGLLPPSADVLAGSVRFEGRDLAALTPAQLRAIRGKSIAMVFQEPMTSLNPVFMIGRQIGEVLRRHEGLSRGAARRRTLELLELVGIPAPDRRVREYPHQLSGGMRQRVMIAMAVACGPRILIADEPTTALDVTIQAGILDVMRDLREQLGTAIILITHDLGVVADVADRVVVLYAGRKIEEAAVHDLYADPQHPYTIGLLGAMPRPSSLTADRARRRLREIPGIVPTRTRPADHCLFAPRCPRAAQRCREHLPPLEDKRPGHAAACYYPGREREGAAS